jgi:hypothetical protein
LRRHVSCILSCVENICVTVYSYFSCKS